ncbi:UvrD-helicase domain-containing protein [Psychroflexus planctonicus]|uniref:DNA 3'-5' helicase n=1 Tax=Psychroflexus planctonicus TaxID=1526575 RepID=A0ABQ1SHI6_9FLAO|nr:UvrD-helicase domain-containing protein [Psychroflexus planctonicus]GGE35175.1 ATP-dependent helicase [Psychroflexus planctonicus]
MEKSSPFVIYNASAGSGKTFTLTVDYLSILLLAKDPFAFQRVLAITFTNKAVGEMKSRVLEHLIAFSKTEIPDDKKALYEQVKAKTQLTDEAISEKAGQILKHLLANYAAFEISTIDAFTQRIIRTFAKDLGLTNNFEIELETQVILEEAVDRVIDKAGEDEQLTQVLVDFALEKTEEDKSGNISKDVFEASKLLLKEQDAEPIAALQALRLSAFIKHKKALKQKEKDLLKKLNDIGKGFFELLENHQIEASSFTRGSIPKYFEKLNNENPSLSFNTKWQDEIETTAFYNKSTAEDQKASIDALRDEIVQLYKQSKQTYFEHNYTQKIKSYITQLSLLNVVQQELADIKTERNLVLISDFNKKISEQVKQQPAPFIYERLGERFQHYFIDEFQDTSSMQWENLIPLVEEALVIAHPEYGHGSLSLIGDAKQSIYAWRGGDAQQFINLSNGQTPFPIEVTAKSLDYNYRSEQEIIQFNNAFFEFVAASIEVPEVQALYSQAAQKSPKKEQLGKVSIDFSPIQNAEEALEVFPQKVVRCIQTRMASNEVQYKDFCVLVRKKKQGIAVAKALNEVQIPIISSETLLISNSKEVQFLIALLKCLENENNQEEAYLLLDYLLNERQFSTTEKHNFLAEAFQQKNIWNSIAELGFAFSPLKCAALPIYDAVEYTIHCFLDLEKADAYLQFFLDEVFAFSNKQAGDLQSFLVYWERVQDNKSISAPEGENAVQIMTIHKSKGLQFSIVLFPFATEKMDDTNLEKFWIPTENPEMPFVLASGKSTIYKELDQEKAKIYTELKNKTTFNSINLLYVALTRAAKEMYIFSAYKENKNGIGFVENSYSAMFYEFLQVRGDWEEDKFQYHFGNDFIFPAPTETAKHNLQLQFNRPNTHLSLLTNAANLFNDELQLAIERGNILHELMANIKGKADVLLALNKGILAGWIAKDEAQLYQDWLQQITMHPDLTAYFETDWQILNEQEIAYQQQLFRPDRICLKGKTAVIIDYKTGSPNANHQQQIKTYQIAVEALGYQVEKTFLVYLNDNLEVVEV